MIDVDTLLYCRWVVPVIPRGLVLEDHAIAIDGGRIVEVLPGDVAAARYRGREVIQLDTHAVTPGLVNAHTHAAMTLLRGVGDDLPLMRWLTQRIWPLEKALVSPEFVYDGTRLAALEMLRSGTTCASDMYFYPEASVRGFRALGMRAVVGIIAIEFPTAYAADAEDYLRKGLAARDALRDDALANFTLAPHAPYTVSDATLQRIAMLADELDLPIHTHVHETEDEIRQSIAQYGCRPLARLDRVGLVSERLIAVHAVHLEDEEFQLLAERGASIAHCPASNLKLGSGIAPVAGAAAAGVNLAIGTDGAASNNRIDMLSELRLAALLAKGATGDASALPAPAILEAGTLGGARALGLQDRIGSIEAGKEADLVAFDLAPPETQPLYDVISHLVYCTGREQVSDVWVAGRRVVEGRHPILLSVHQDLMAGVGAWQNRCRQVLLTSGAS
ncbi:MAG: TRZ/ATZ family hydrolase [Burkholderiaceae bacterium]|jgi:5-methylthioadenosine/S-adenosylhomocysteine deaminase|nr:TRZ/ATZ family hydrolase [Burkholderiaceae bacterium]